MEKKELIKCITNILNNYGCFTISELDVEQSGVFINEMGSLIALGEYFTQDYVEVNVYKPSSSSSDPIDSYETGYEYLEEDVLSDILERCEQWEAQNLKTEKRISN